MTFQITDYGVAEDEFAALRDYIKNWDGNTSTNWNNSELLNKEQEVWLKRRLHDRMGEPFKKHDPIVIPYRWNEDVPQGA